MKPLITATVLIALAGPSLADSPIAVSEYSRSTSSLKLVERSDGGEKGYFATFRGKAILTGTVVVEFDRAPGMNEGKDTTGASFFLPNVTSREKLPAAIGTFYPSPVVSIDLDLSPAKLLPLIVSKAKAQAILSGDQPRYEIAAQIEVKSFSAWVECGRREYTAEVVSASALSQQVVTRAKRELIGC